MKEIKTRPVLVSTDLRLIAVDKAYPLSASISTWPCLLCQIEVRMQGLEPLPSVLLLWQMNSHAQVTTGSNFLCSVRGALRVGAVPQHLY